MQSAETRMVNETIVNGITSGDNFLQKQAADGMNDYLRMKIRENGYARRIITPITVTAADLDRQVDTAKPVIVRDKEPSTPPAYSVPFGTTPMNQYIKGPRYRVMFDRILSRRFTADVNTLLTYDMDIRQILNDFLLKDIMGEEDRKMTDLANYLVGPVNGGSLPDSGYRPELGYARLNVTAGPIVDRVPLAHAMKGLPSTNRHLNPSIGLVNNITIWDVAALTRDKIGGDLAEEIFVNGFGERQIMGLKWLITIKTDLVLTNELFMFTEPKFLGDFFVLDDVTVSTKNENYMIEFFGYECIGATIANDAAVAKVSFSGSLAPWVKP